MSELDTLNTRSTSGVPMRARPKPREPTVAEAVAAVIAQLAASNEKLAASLAALTPKAPSAHLPGSISFERGPDGLISGGTCTSSAGAWAFQIFRTDGVLSIGLSPK